MSIGVIGLGNWGTALAQHLASKGEKVLAWTNHEEVVHSINNHHKNPRYLTSVTLAPTLQATSRIEEVALKKTILFVLPSHVLCEFQGIFPTISPDALLISGVKGLESSESLTPLQYFLKSGCQANLVVLSGPCFAKDLASGQPAGLVAASKDEESAKQTATLFTTDRVKVYTSLDPFGVELGGIVKNTIALAAGVSDGLQFGDSARAGLITRGLAEMIRLGKALGADARTLSGLSGLGDLVMTASCDTSRNRQVGLRLGQGESLPLIVKTLGSTAEAVKSTPQVRELAQKYGVEMPITEAVFDLLTEKISPHELASRLLRRPSRFELE